MVEGSTVGSTEPNVVAFEVNGPPSRCPPAARCSTRLRDHLGITSAKDGCSPQGQCGCCTVWVDGQPRVACVTPVGARRRSGRDDARRPRRRRRVGGGVRRPRRAASAASARRGSSCASPRSTEPHASRRRCRQALARPPLPLHRLAADRRGRSVASDPAPVAARFGRRQVPSGRARLEGGAGAGRSAPRVALGRAGSPTTPHRADALVAVLGADGEWVVGETLAEARQLSGKVQGRRTTAPLTWPVDVPRRRLGAHAADDVGRAGLPRARRRRGASPAASRRAARQRWGVRRQGRRPRSATSPGAWPTSTAVPCACCPPARTSCGTDRSDHRSPPASAPTAPG